MRAAAVATALDKLYPPPPVPRDRRGRPMFHLQEPKEVHITADTGTNTIIVDAPRQRLESLAALVEQRGALVERDLFDAQWAGHVDQQSDQRLTDRTGADHVNDGVASQCPVSP